MQTPPIVFGDAALRAELTLSQAPTLTLLDAESGKSLGTSPLFQWEICDRRMPRVEYYPEAKVLEVEETATGVHLTVYEQAHDIYAGIWLSVEEGELRVVVPPAEVREDRGEIYRLFAINVLPELLACGPKGTVFLPLQTGCVFSPAEAPETKDQFMIYGDQERWELCVHLPACAVKDEEGGLMAMAVQGAAETRCDVRTDGKGNGRTGFAAVFRGQWPDPVEVEEREIVYTPIAADSSLEVSIGKRLRRHVMADLGKTTLKQRAAESPEVAYLLKAYIMKLFYGIQQRGAMMGNSSEQGGQVLFKRVMSFDQALEKLEGLKAAGIEHILTQSVGWNIRGHDGLWPTRFPVERRLGGEAKFRNLIQQGLALGYHMTVHENLAAAYPTSADFDPDLVAHSIWGEPRVIGYWGGGIKHSHWGVALPPERVEGRLEEDKALGIKGALYIDGMGNPLWINYHPKNGGTRSDCARGYNRYTQAARKIFGSCGTEMGFLNCTIPADSMVHIGGAWQLSLFRPEWPISRLDLKLVPVWQLALNGLVVVESHGEGWTDIMRTVLYGQKPRAEWSAEPGIMPVLDDDLLARIKAVNEICIERFGHLVAEEMSDWRRLGDKVEQTAFADGTVVVADFATETLTVNGEQVERVS